MKKIVHAFVCIFAVLFIFAACSADSGDSGSSEKSSESETVEKKTEPDKKEPETDKQVYYTLTLDANGGEGTIVYNNIKANQYFVLKKAAELGVKRTDYTFLGWAGNSSAETATYADGGTVVINSNTTLYAVWKKNAETKTDTQKENQSENNQNSQSKEDETEPVSHTVTFETNGGSDIPAKTVSYGETVSEPAAPTKDGYVFKGWYTSSNFSSPYTFGNTISDDITLYAKWDAIEYSIEYELNGGSWKSNNAKTSFTVEDCFVLPDAEKLIKTGYGFTGWHEKSDLTDAAVLQIAKGTTENKKYYASWEAGMVNYTVRHFKQNLSRNGYDEAISDKQVLTGKTNNQTSASALSYDGFTSKEFSQIEIKADGTSEVKIYYDRNSYTVTFETNGGSGISAQTLAYGATVTEPTAPTKAGFAFKGWYTNSNFSSPYTFGSSISDNITLYAKWDAIEYSIEYELNGGSWKSNNAKTSFTVEDCFVLPDAEKLIKTGYGFTGWHEKSDLTDAAVLQIAKGTTENKKYYASWEAGMVNYTVRHFKQNLSRNGYDEAISDKQVLTGKTNNQTSASALSYDGFTSKEFSQIEIKADGTSEVKIYYDRNSYTVTFETNGGSGISAQTLAYGATVTEPTAPTKAGFAFKGWYTNSNFSSPYTFGSSISDNITLYAKWQNTASISVTVSPNSTVAITKTEDGSSITLTATSGHSSYTWKIDDSVATSFSGATVNGNKLTINKSKLVEGWRYQISLYAPKNGIPYSAQITVKKGE